MSKKRKTTKTTERILGTYNRQADKLSDQYQGVSTEDVLKGLKERLPRLRALDIACGNGRDARWLAGQGFIVDAVDGSEGMIEKAREVNAHENVTYGVDLMPDLAAIREKGEKYDAITMSAAWMHLKPNERKRMFETITELARPGAMIFITLRHGPGPDDRPMFAVNAEELQRLATRNLMSFEHITEAGEDKLGRGDVWWDSVCLNVPEGRTEALEVFRDSVIKAPKYTSYKLGLGLCVTELLSQRDDLVREVDDSRVAIPLGHVMMRWAQIYDAMADEGLAQIPQSDRVNDPLNATRRFAEVSQQLSPVDLKPGMTLKPGQHAQFLRMMKSMRNTILNDGPVKFITRRDSGVPLFDYEPGTDAGQAGKVKVDDAYLRETFGELILPRDVAGAAKEFSALITAGIAQEWIDFASRLNDAPEDKLQTRVRKVLRVA